MFPLAFVAGWLQGHWWGFISRNYVVWPTFFLMNVFIALKGSHFWLLAQLSRRLTRWAYSIPMVRRPSVVRHPSVVHTFKLEYLWNQLASLDQILCIALQVWGKGCIRFGGRLDQNSGFYGNRKPPLTYNGVNDVSIFSRLFLIRFFLSLQVTRTCIKSRTSSNFGQIWPLTTELAVIEVLKISHRLIMGKWCLHASSFIFDRIIIKVAGNQDRHKSSDEFKFGPLVSMAHLYIFWNERMSIELRWAIVALWATCYSKCWRAWMRDKHSVSVSLMFVKRFRKVTNRMAYTIVAIYSLHRHHWHLQPT